MYSKLSKSNFKLMLEYLDGLRGNQRRLAKERAEKVVAQNEAEKDNGELNHIILCIFFWHTCHPWDLSNLSFQACVQSRVS